MRADFVLLLPLGHRVTAVPSPVLCTLIKGIRSKCIDNNITELIGDRDFVVIVKLLGLVDGSGGKALLSRSHYGRV